MQSSRFAEESSNTSGRCWGAGAAACSGLLWPPQSLAGWDLCGACVMRPPKDIHLLALVCRQTGCICVNLFLYLIAMWRAHNYCPLLRPHRAGIGAGAVAGGGGESTGMGIGVGRGLSRVWTVWIVCPTRLAC